MLCSSVSTTTPTTCSTTGPNQKPPNWLDRLHLSKGFSLPSPDLHLDHFLLRSPPNPDPCPSPPPPPPLLPPPPPKNDPSDPKPASRGRKKHLPLPSTSAAPDDKQKRTQLVDLMSSALAELFVMGGPRPAAAFKKKKGARKQPNPRACNPSAASASVDEGGGRDRPAATPPSSADNSVAEANKKIKDGWTKGRKKRAPAGGAGELDLSAYSRTEVTVIDSSVPGWKSEKVIFRKGTFWKVRDKKARIFSKKKRNLGLVERLAVEKEAKEPLDCSKLPLASPPQGRSYADKREASKEVDRTSVSVRRKFARSPRVPLGRNASVLHLQVIASNKKNEPSGSSPKPINR